MEKLFSEPVGDTMNLHVKVNIHSSKEVLNKTNVTDERIRLERALNEASALVGIETGWKFSKVLLNLG